MLSFIYTQAVEGHAFVDHYLPRQKNKGQIFCSIFHP